MSILCNFNSLMGILLRPIDLLESNDDIKCTIYVLLVGPKNKETLDLFFR